MCAGARELRAPAPGKPQRPENRSAHASIRTPNTSTNPREYSDVKLIDKPAQIFWRQTHRPARAEF